MVKPAPKKSSSGFVILPILLLIALGTVALAAKSVYDKQHVLGEESSLIAQAPPGGDGGGGGGSAPPSGGGESGGSAPPSGGGGESQPAPQQQNQPQQNQAPQPGSGGSYSNPQPGSGQVAQQYQPKNTEEQRQYQQYNQQSPEQQKQTYQKYQQQGEQQRTQQYQPSGQNGPQQQNQYQGTGQGGQQGTGGQQNQNVYNPQFSQEQYQQFQKKYEQEASKFGFQINGSLPPEFLDRQNSQGQIGQAGNAGTGQAGGSTGQNQQTGAGQNSNTGTRFGTNFFSMPPVDLFPTIQGNFNVTASSGGANIDLNEGNTRLQLWGKGPNSPLTAVRPDGTQVPIDKAEFEKINAAVKLVTGSEVAQNGDVFSLKRGQVEANTKLPISFNMATKSFTVQTANGEKEIAVLPDEAAQKLIENKIFTDLQTTTTTQEGTTTEQVAVSLTELDNKPVYEVQGASRQRFLGFAPVSISKTVYVSAEDGSQVKTNQTFTSQLLDLISF